MKAFIAWLEAAFAGQRDTINCLVVSMVALPMLGMPWLMQVLSFVMPTGQSVYRPEWRFPFTLCLGALLAALAIFAWHCWRHRHEHAPRPAKTRVLMTVVLLLLTVQGVAYGYKDTPLALFWLGMFFLGRALFGARSIRDGYWLSLVLVACNEVAMATDFMRYAPLLAEPVYAGQGLSDWWSVWLRALYLFAAFPLCGLFYLLFDILHKERLQLEALVRTDALTGLANRREFMSHLQQECRRQLRNRQPLCVMICDVDHFKKINDTWGHVAGDQVLRYLGALLREATRDHVAMPARLGGEEFVVLFPETGLEDARKVAEDLLQRLQAHEFESEGNRFTVTQSVGIAQVSNGDGDLGLRVADANLYIAKHKGRNCIVASLVSDPIASDLPV